MNSQSFEFVEAKKPEVRAGDFIAAIYFFERQDFVFPFGIVIALIPFFVTDLFLYRILENPILFS